MIIIGAKGFAKELLEVCQELGKTNNLVFYDDLSTDLPGKIYGEFDILHSETEVKSYFREVDKRFALGIGNPILRKKMTDLFTSWGGELISIISPKAHIGEFGVRIDLGATILAGASITGDVNIGKCLLMYPNSVITHGCKIGDFVELSPGAVILGNCNICDFAHIGSNATILPKLSVGEKSVIGAGGVLTKSIKKDTVVKGNPAK